MKALILISAAILANSYHADAQYYFKEYSVVPDSGLISDHPSQLTSFGGTLLYNAGSPRNRELYKLQGDVVSLVKDIYPGNLFGSDPVFTNQTAILNGKIFFYANDGVNGTELWQTDGTPGGTAMVKNIGPNLQTAVPQSMTAMAVFNGKIFFAANDSVHGTELWVSDGTAAGTQMVKDIFTIYDSQPNDFTVYNSKLYFTAIDNTDGRGLWVTDGTAAGTTKLIDINSTPGANANVSNLIVHGNQLYFTATTATEGHELWVTDGTIAGTKIVKDIAPGAANGINYLNGRGTSMNGKFYFLASGGGNTTLWVTDGTAAGTAAVSPSTNAQAPTHGSMIAHKNKLYYIGGNSATGYEPWVSDGTVAGTHMLIDIIPGTASSNSYSFTVFDDNVYFVGGQYNTKWRLYGTNGTTAGTVALEPPGTPATAPQLISSYDLQVLGDGLYFKANYFNNETKLWSFRRFAESVANTEKQTDITLYPNPAHHNFTIKTSTVFKTGSVTLTDITGRVVKSQKLNTNIETISVEGIAPGIYMADVQLDDKRTTQKLVVE